MWLLVVLCVYSTLAQFMMNYGNDWDMYLVPSYVGTQIWGTASNHVLLLSSRKSCLMTSRGKLVHWWGSWEGAGGPGRAAAARRRRRRPPVRRPRAPPAGGAGHGGGSAGSARGDGPRRRRGEELSAGEGKGPPDGASPPPPGASPAPPGASPPPPGRSSAGLRAPRPGEAGLRHAQILRDPSSDAGRGRVPVGVPMIVPFLPRSGFREASGSRRPAVAGSYAGRTRRFS